MNLVEKYERYRAILKNSFLVVGEGQGHSLPADARNAEYLHFGDATLFLGWYTGILSTEYYLLSKKLIKTKALNANETLEELFFAISALSRLIDTAMDSFKPVCGESNKVRGFFIRDDVADDIKQYYSGVERVASDFMAENPYMKEESQDQLIHLLLGFSLVKKFIPKDVRIRGQSILELVEELAFDLCAFPAKTKWVIRNPYCGYKKVRRGPSAFIFSFPLVASLLYINKKGEELLPTVKWIFKFIWKNIMKFYLPVVYTPTNLHLVLTLACMSNSWKVKRTCKLSKKFGWCIYPLLQAVLHDGKKPEVDDLLAEARSMLDSAPEDGLSHGSSPRGWKSSHRFLSDLRSQNEGQPWYRSMRFSGVDFMLLANVYQIFLEKFKTN